MDQTIKLFFQQCDDWPGYWLFGAAEDIVDGLGAKDPDTLTDRENRALAGASLISKAYQAMS